MAVTKGNAINLRVSDKLNGWLEEQSQVLGMNKSEVVRFWLNYSMLAFNTSIDAVNKAVKSNAKVADGQLPGQLDISDLPLSLIGGK